MKRTVSIAIAFALFAVTLLGPEPDPSNPAVGRTLAVALAIAVLWLTEAIPLAATALLPVGLFPLLGIMPGKEVAPVYLNNILFLFMGGFLIAIAMERWNLHRRIALRIILAVGGSPKRLLLGFMLGSWCLSMWVSNTATTMMMVPIVVALLVKLQESVALPLRRLEVALLLGVAYASSIGGMATLIGTAPNLSFARIYALSFPDAPAITFLYWLGIGLPVSAALFVAVYLLLRRQWLRRVVVEVEKKVIQEEYQRLGRPSFEEKTVMVVFSLFGLLLVTRADLHLGGTVLHGWASLFGAPEMIDDGTVAIAVALILFIVPSKSEEGSVLGGKAIAKLPWDIIVLLGGGFALAKGFQESGLSQYLGGQLSGLSGLPAIVVVLAICAMITFLTELTSNTATTQVVLPIIAALSGAIHLPPLLLMVPATIAASCAFMLPVATPPNAIVFATHRLSIKDMARTGITLNFIAIAAVALLVYAIGSFLF